MATRVEVAAHFHGEVNIHPYVHPISGVRSGALRLLITRHAHKFIFAFAQLDAQARASSGDAFGSHQFVFRVLHALQYTNHRSLCAFLALFHI